MNPVDAKVRAGAAPFEGRSERILGWDAAEIVEAVGPEATRFKAAMRSSTRAVSPAAAALWNHDLARSACVRSEADFSFHLDLRILWSNGRTADS